MPIRGRYSPFNLTAFNQRLDHGLLLGLADDDHSQYLLTDGTRDLTGNWVISSNSITLTNGLLNLTNGGISAFGNILITNNDLILWAGDIKIGNPFTDSWTNAGVLTVSDSIVLDNITMDSTGYTSTSGQMVIQDVSFNNAGLDAPDILTVVGGDAVSPAIRGSDILFTAGGGGIGDGGDMRFKTKIGAVNFGDIFLAEDGGNVIIGNTSVTIDASGNFTNVGNITGSDIDISAGTGDYLSTGDINCATLTVGDGGTTDYFSVSVTGDGQFFGAGDLLVGNNKYFARSATASNVGIFFNQTSTRIEFRDTSANVLASFAYAVGGTINLNNFTVAGGLPTEITPTLVKDKLAVFKDGSGSGNRRTGLFVMEVGGAGTISNPKIGLTAFAYTIDDSTIVLTRTDEAGGLAGGRYAARVHGDGTVSLGGGVSAFAEILSGSPAEFTDAYCFQAEGIIEAGSGTGIVNAHAVWIRNGSGNIGTYTGLDIDDIDAGTTNNPIHQRGTTGTNLLKAETRFGSSTAYEVIETDGDTFWVGAGTGLPYGHMYVDGTQAIRVALTLNTPTEVEDDGTTSAEDGWLAGDLNLITFPTGGTEHHITITKAGVYLINWNISFTMVTGAANTQIHGGLTVDSTTFIRDKCEGHRTISNNTDTGHMSGSCIVDLPNGNEELSLWMENTTNSNDADVSHGSLVAVQVGGT